MATSNSSIIPTRISTTNIPEILNKYLSDEKAIFVFPSSIARDSWCEWTVKNWKTTGVKCTPMERWMAWDEFKAAWCTVDLTGRSCVPSSLRKLFARHVLSRELNAETPYFEQIVNTKSCKSVIHFNSWLSKLIPNLKTWADKKFPGMDIESDYEKMMSSLTDAEDRDFFKLFHDYYLFLENNSLYEPSYLEKTFTGKDNTFIIFYPETSDDYFDYKELFENENVITINVPVIEKHEDHPECILYPDSRTELRKTILKIRELHDEKNISWEDIALTVPDLKTSSPYIERELKLYEIPYLLRSGYDKTINCPGQLFTEIEQCVKNNFGFFYLRALMEDTYVPWSKKDIFQRIIDIASETRSLFPYNKSSGEETEDPIILALEKLEKTVELEVYSKFKECLSGIYRAKTFSSIREAWKHFNSSFIDSKQNVDGHWKEDKNNVIGLCIKNLDELVEIEKNFITKDKKQTLYINKRYDFFLDKLREEPYVPESEKFQAVSVFDYKVSGPAFYKYQFIINANQKDLSVNYRELDFLKEEKRKDLNCKDNNLISEGYINLYNKEGTSTLFSCAQNSFNGFAISHTYFNEKKAQKIPDLKELDKNDFYVQERNWLLNQGEAPKFITSHQKEAAENWISRIRENDTETEITLKNLSPDAINKLKYATLGEDSLDKDGKYIKISQTDLKNFFPCPRKWLFIKLFAIEEDNVTQTIFDHFDAGNIFHETLDHWLSDFYKGKNLPVTGTASWDETTIKNQIRVSYEKVLTPPENGKIKAKDFKVSPLRLQVLKSQSDKMVQNIYDFLYSLCTEGSENPKGHFGNFLVIGTEASFMNQIKGMEDSDYRLFGKADCILSSDEENGGESIIDFKTSNPPSGTACKMEDKLAYIDGQTVSGKILKDFQMACYTTLLDPVYNVQEGVFVSSKIDKDSYNTTYAFSNRYTRSKPRDDSEGFNNTLPVFDDYVNTFVQNLEKANYFPDFNSKDLKLRVDINDHCKKCKFKSICRTTYTMAKIDEAGGTN